MTYTPAGQGFLAESEALQTAANSHMPKQVSALDSIKSLLTGRQVPGEGFGKVSGSQTASSGHQTNVQDGAQRLRDAMKRLSDWIGGVNDSDDAYRQNDQQRAQQTDDIAQPVRVAQNAGPTSQNGYPVDPPRSSRTVPGTGVRLNVANGDAGDVLVHVADEFNRRVENIDQNAPTGEADDWGYAHRNVRGSSTTISNHASGTAIDLNAGSHPRGVPVANTFTPAQIDEIHNIVNETGGVVRWGGDYQHAPVDGMHFEIVGTPDQVAAYAQQLRNAQQHQQPAQ
ncbi:M15 family metallopeptidase [Labedaea rhizosphaerae]|uniref:D-alanyl-D-alanine carboxypeptidase-like protein n=1 Tax=Labedaea rhizosphaerae TaxID=598644 RepID=A0A4R6S5W1_LABRH|nr:M15 family metallopeptidase [Labedaea rhizosphaerae]TDP95051.1 D-alanyl-D-alanine carboxypeptidase-like protein [Labedaea rhizosphaerae]